MGLKIGVVGATGMVGEVFMDLLNKNKLPFESLKPFASEKSAGKKIEVMGKLWEVESLKPNCFDGLDLVFFSSGDDISKEWAPQAVQSGAFAVDNSGAFRMDPNTPLVVPEVNGHLLTKKLEPCIIANPNCSTIQMVVALNALKSFGLKSVRVATYQSVSGAGKPGQEELETQTKEFAVRGEVSSKPKAFAHQIAFNCVPHIGSFNDEGFCSEEVKMMRETQKILDLPNLPVSAFTVRVPTLNSHSEACWVKFDRSVELSEVEEALKNAQGLEYVSQQNANDYPTPVQASGEEPVYVGRLHKDGTDENTWLMWIVADNILKGAALNGMQIAQKIFA